MTKPKKFVFVLMPFEKKFNDIYKFGIKQTCAELDAYCERVDEQIFSERILDRIYNQISKADLIIADMTGRNANVFYEVGYSHAINKNVILLTQESEDIPFDLKHFPHIIYNGEIDKLKESLSTRIQWYLNQENELEKTDYDFGLKFSINGERIEENSVIKLLESNNLTSRFELNIDIFNSSSKSFRNKFSLGLETTQKFNSLFKTEKIIKTPNNKILIGSNSIEEIYPQSYKSVRFIIDTSPHFSTKDTAEVPITLKIFTNFELREINFTLIIPLDTKPRVW